MASVPKLWEDRQSARRVRDQRVRTAAHQLCRGDFPRECLHRADRNKEPAAGRANNVPNRWSPCPPTAPRLRCAAAWHRASLLLALKQHWKSPIRNHWTRREARHSIPLAQGKSTTLRETSHHLHRTRARQFANCISPDDNAQLVEIPAQCPSAKILARF